MSNTETGSKPRTPATAESIAELRKSLTSDTSVVRATEAEIWRQNKTAEVNERIAAEVDYFAETLSESGDLDAVAGILRNLKTIKSRAAKAIAGIPDSALEI